MQLVHLSLTNFRNFIRLEMEFPPGPTLVVGPNAQGKTSLLEAIDYLVAAESPRAGNDRELINFLAARQPDAFSRIVAEYRRGDRASHPGGDPRRGHWKDPGVGPNGSRVRLVAKTAAEGITFIVFRFLTETGAPEGRPVSERNPLNGCAGVQR
jgi:hypothetical protein